MDKIRENKRKALISANMNWFKAIQKKLIVLRLVIIVRGRKDLISDLSDNKNFMVQQYKISI